MISLIVAVDKNLLIGNSKGMPWYIKEDLAYFREVTRGKTVVMGRKTFESIGRPLPNRRNIVITRTPKLIEGVEVINDLDKFIAQSTPNEDVFIIGGAEIYSQAYPYVEDLYVTHIDAEFSGDTYFPNIYFSGTFRKVDEQSIISSEGIKLTFTKYKRSDHK